MGLLVVRGEKKLLLTERERERKRYSVDQLAHFLIRSLAPPSFSCSPSFSPRLISPLTSACMRAYVHPISLAGDLGCPHLRLLVVALGDLVVGDVHQPNLGLLVPRLAAEDLDKTAGNISVWEVERGRGGGERVGS